MSFPFNAYFAAFVAAALTAAFSLPAWRAFCQRCGLVDDPGHRKIHNTPTPLAGGLAVLTGILLPLILGVAALRWNLGAELFPQTALGHGFARRGTELLAILLGAAGMVALGVLDDRHELRPAWKFGGQLIIALLVAAAGVRITLFVPSLFFSYAVTALWILTVVNAFNFLDNMNGLCAGLGAIAAWCFALGAAMEGQYLVALLALLACGALVGFLPFNFPKASAFLGDAGSHLVGYLLAVLAILPHFCTPENPRKLSVLTPLLVLAVPLGDLVWVVILRWRLGQPFYVGDNNHISHRLVRKGFSRTQAVLFIWYAATAFAALALL